MESRITTTSWPSSTRRLARSMASSATAQCSVGGRSNVDATISPLVERCMSVTSSGRSSTSTTIRCASGLLRLTALAIDCRIVVLPALGGATMRARCPLPSGMTRSMTRVIRQVRLGLQPQPLLREERGQVVEVGAAARIAGVAPVDGVDPHQRVVPILPVAAAAVVVTVIVTVVRLLLARSGGADDLVAAPQPVLPHEGRCDVDVVLARGVAAGAQECVVADDVDDAFDRTLVDGFGHFLVLLRRQRTPTPQNSLGRQGTCAR